MQKRIHCQYFDEYGYCNHKEMKKKFLHIFPYRPTCIFCRKEIVPSFCDLQIIFKRPDTKSKGQK